MCDKNSNQTEDPPASSAAGRSLKKDGQMKNLATRRGATGEQSQVTLPDFQQLHHRGESSQTRHERVPDRVGNRAVNLSLNDHAEQTRMARAAMLGVETLVKGRAGGGQSKKQDKLDQPGGQNRLAETPDARLMSLHYQPIVMSPPTLASLDFNIDI